MIKTSNTYRQNQATNKTLISVVLSTVMVAVLLIPGFASALSSEQRNIYQSGIYYFDNEVFASQSCGGTGPNDGESLPSSIPAVWRDLINSTASTYPTVNPRLVAATLWVENRGWPEFKSTGWSKSPVGAQGPWQFMPATWASMGTDGDGDGIKDPNNPRDAVHGAFKHQLGSRGKPLAVTGYTGNVDEDFNTVVFERKDTNLLYYMAKYNGRGAPDNTKLSAFPKNENSNYVIMSYWLIGSNFTKGYLIEQGKFVDATEQGSLFNKNSSQEPVTGNSCTGISIDGYSFPVAPQRKSQNGGLSAMSALPCNRIACHHDGSPAFDISAKPGGDSAVGKAIYAINGGVVKQIRSTYKGQVGCQSFQLVGEDGYWYWYGHIQGVSVGENQTVTAGQQIATLGERRCTGNGSDPHLHIDRGCVTNGVKRPGGSDACRDPGLTPLMNNLFENLPE